MNEPAHPLRMAHVALTATFEDFERVSEFYRDVFGWSIERELRGPFGHHRFLTDGHGSRIELIARAVVERPKFTPDPPGHICFAVPEREFDAVLERARRAGVSVGEPNLSMPADRNDTSGGPTRYVFFDDPSGNCIEVSSGAYRALGLA